MTTEFASSAPPTASQLTIEVDGGTTTTVRMSGEMDFSNAGIVAEAIGGIELDGHLSVVLDLTGLRFCDAAGVSAVLTAQRRVTASGGRLSIRAASGEPRRIFLLTGVDRVLDIE
jgi:anti-sigma B factor antagonist